MVKFAEPVNKMVQWTLIYDNKCNTCSGSAAALQKIDKSKIFKMLPLAKLDSEYGAVLLEKRPEIAEISEKDLILVSPEMELYQGAAAIEKIIELLPLARPVRWMLERIIRKTPAYSFMKSVRRGCRNCP